MKQAVALTGLLVGSTLIALLLAEVSLRLIGAPRGGVFTVTEAQFHEVPGVFQPGLQARVTTIPPLEHTVTINSLGYRGRDLPREKPDEEVRIFFIGDSFVFGDYVEDHETLPAQLEGLLRTECPSVRVLNMGLGGSTITEHIPLLQRAYELDPDLVILLFSSNDVSDLRGTSLWEELARNRRAKSAFPVSVIYPVVRETALWHVLLRTRGLLRTLRRTQPDPVAEPDRETGVSPDRGQLKERYTGLLAELTEELERKGITYLFTAFPSHHTVAGTKPVPEDTWILETASNLEIPTVELISPLVESGLGTGDLYLLPHDGHPGPEGYRVAGLEIAERVQRLIPSCHE